MEDIEPIGIGRCTGRHRRKASVIVRVGMLDLAREPALPVREMIPRGLSVGRACADVNLTDIAALHGRKEPHHRGHRPADHR